MSFAPNQGIFAMPGLMNLNSKMKYQIPQQQAPQPSPQGLKGLFDPSNRQALMQLGIGLLNGSAESTVPGQGTLSAGLAQGFQGYNQAQNLAKEQLFREQQAERDQANKDRRFGLDENTAEARARYTDGQTGHQEWLQGQAGINRDFKAEQNALDRGAAQTRAGINASGMKAQANATMATLKAQEMAQKMGDAENQNQLDLLNFDSNLDEMKSFREDIKSFSESNLELMTGHYDRAQALINPGSDQADLAGRHANLTAKATLDRLSYLKSQSKTGATGFGALSQKELEVIENGIASLSASTFYNLSPKEKRNQVNKVFESVDRVVNRMEKERGINSKFQRAIKSNPNLRVDDNDPLGIL